uniref:SPOR domain-containing protein n=1 Tax=Magnetococcus massalia (strain MO-1) TaxID=451514 RepID=A0A1S7LN40_MAGMO|nr:Exported protein of unknown function [Candidatus Magnetococcus massalia]
MTAPMSLAMKLGPLRPRYPALLLTLLLLTSCMGTTPKPVAQDAAYKPPPPRVYRLMVLPIQEEKRNPKVRAMVEKWLKRILAIRTLGKETLPVPLDWMPVPLQQPAHLTTLQNMKVDHLLGIKLLEYPSRKVRITIWGPSSLRPIWQEDIAYFNHQDIQLALRLIKKRLHRYLGDVVWVELKSRPDVRISFKTKQLSPQRRLISEADNAPPTVARYELPSFFAQTAEQVEEPPQLKPQPAPRPRPQTAPKQETKPAEPVAVETTKRKPVQAQQQAATPSRSASPTKGATPLANSARSDATQPAEPKLEQAPSTRVKETQRATPHRASPAEALTPASAAPDKLSKGSGFAIQIGAYISQKMAQKVAGRLSKKGFKPFILAYQHPQKGALYLVRLGYFATLKEARAVEKRYLDGGGEPIFLIPPKSVKQDKSTSDEPR